MNAEKCPTAENLTKCYVIMHFSPKKTCGVEMESVLKPGCSLLTIKMISSCCSSNILHEGASFMFR